ncbi:FAD-dependent monooxygenase [Leekyejoonella antrihumi]|uniref:FAD-dependent monooxygenase n=1 Tax=Leekyejoonella antrihumi TaxID=1660198 RepID=UPI001FE416B8|nr:FAD-dependent monooxygenase [Leekyejoonella antrihumi]
MIGIIGGGVGGLATAIALARKGIRVQVFEQSSRFGRVGADINLTPNAVRALDGLGVGDDLRRTAARPARRISRTWNTGVVTSRLEMGNAAEEKYGSPQLTMHRADLLTALEQALPEGALRFGSKLAGLTPEEDGARLELVDGTTEHVDVLIGADGIHSVVRSALLGQEHPEFTGVVAYRAVVPGERLTGVPDRDAFTKWWGPDPATQIVTFPLTRGNDTFIFATTPQDDWREESWTTPGSVEELRAAYSAFHPDARALLDACDTVLKSALYVRSPLPTWSQGCVTLLGDACHPMMPFMAQGAGMAIEDAVVLARSIAAHDDVANALKAYEVARVDRTSRVQTQSRSNEWLKDSSNGDWVYGYDAWTVPL